MAKVEANIDELNKLMRMLKKDYIVRIGILGDKACAEHDSKSGMTNAELGEVHEFGANIKHPGGTPYKILENGKSIFVKKSEGEGLPVTKPHSITIPRRSFLEDPLKEHLWAKIKPMKKIIWKQLFVKNAPDEFFKYMMSEALLIVKGAFKTNGYGQWKSLTAASKRRTRGTNKPLMDTLGLSKSISGKIIKE